MTSPIIPARWFTPLFVAGLCHLVGGCASHEEWSNPRISPVGKTIAAAHGTFAGEPVSVTLRDLPDHAWVTVRFKLLMLGSWDGSNVAWGPDLFALRVRGGEQLMMTSFSNLGAKTSCYVQAYPDDFPWALHYAFTGAEPLSGKPFAEPDPVTFAAIADAAYPVTVSFPHRGDRLTLDFTPVYTDPAGDSQRWAITDFEYTTSLKPVAVDDVELYRLWDELAAVDSVRANAAMWKLISAGDVASRFLLKKAAALGDPDRALANQPEGLRLYRMQKALRILGTPQSQAASDNLTYKVPSYNTCTPPVAP